MKTPEWLGRLLADTDATDICLNGHARVFVDRGNGLLPESVEPWSETDLRHWVLEKLSEAGKTWDARHPFVDASLAASGHRLHAVFPPISQNGIVVSLRSSSKSYDALAGSLRWRSSPLFPKLQEIVRGGESIIISGATGSGKTTLAKDLLEEVPRTQRILALEDTPELNLTHPQFVSLVSRPANADDRGEVPLRALLKQALRMRPDRIILGECRGAEVLELLQALNTGHQGALATLHANSPRDALRRIELLCLLASGGTIPVSLIRELLAVGIQWIAQVKRVSHAEQQERRIVELNRIEGREGETILLRPVDGCTLDMRKR